MLPAISRLPALSRATETMVASVESVNDVAAPSVSTRHKRVDDTTQNVPSAARARSIGVVPPGKVATTLDAPLVSMRTILLSLAFTTYRLPCVSLVAPRGEL